MKDQQDIRGIDGRFLKGQSGNPKGRSIGSISIVAILKERLADVPDGGKHTFADELVAKILHKSLKDGDTHMIRDIINRVDGMPHQTTDLTSKGEKLEGIQLTIVKAK